MTTQAKQKLIVVSGRFHRALSRYCEDRPLKPDLKKVNELALKRFFESEKFLIEEPQEERLCPN